MLNQVSFLGPVEQDEVQLGFFKDARDHYYSYLAKKYDCDDSDILDHLITDGENVVREYLELKVMRGGC